MLFVCFCRTFWTPAAVQRSRAICTWRSLDASPGRNSTCSCVAPASTTLLKEHPRWCVTAVLSLKLVWGRPNWWWWFHFSVDAFRDWLKYELLRVYFCSFSSFLLQHNLKNWNSLKPSITLFFTLLLTSLSLCLPTMKQEPRHLQLLSDLEDSNIFTIITGRKLHNAPTDYQFCIKVTHTRKHCKINLPFSSTE